MEKSRHFTRCMDRWLIALLLMMLASLAVRAAESYACYTSSNTTLTFYYDDKRASRTGQTYDMNVGMDDPGWYTDGTNANVTKVVFNSSFGSFRPTSTYEWFYGMYKLQTISGISYLKTDEVTNMGHMFRGCRKLASLDVSRFNTSNVIYMMTMFYDCSILTSLDLRNFNTSKVTTMAGMFYGCTNMESIDVSNFNTSKVTNMAIMFYGCSSLTTIYAGSEWNTAAVSYSDHMFTNSPNLVGGQGTTYDANHLDVSYAHIDGGPSNPGYFSEKGPEPYACFTEGNSTLTFYYDTQRRTREGTTYDLNSGTGAPGWRNLGSNGTITKVVFDPSFANARPTSTCEWFYYMTGLTSITGISYLNTSQVTNMKNMFFCCNSLTSLDVSHFNTANVTTMNGMFRGCSDVTSLDVSHFNTASVTDMEYMFESCSALTRLDVSGFNTANVTTMNSMFFGCSNVMSLDVSNFNTAKVTNMNSMFLGCRKLASLDVHNFNTAKVTDMRKMFNNCVGLTRLDVRNFNTAKVTDMYGMFSFCTAMISLDLRGLNTSKVTTMGEMFYGCTNLVSIYVGDGWTTDAVTSSSQMFNNCTSIVGEKGTTYDPNHKDKAYAHIDGGPSNPGYLSSDPPEAYACYTSSNTTLTFYYDYQRASRTGTTYDMNWGLDGSGWYNDGTCANVTRVVFDPSFADARPTSTCTWFYSMPNLIAITGIHYLNTSEVTKMGWMFNCPRLQTLDVRGFNTAKVTRMDCMFYGCSELTSLDVSGFNTSNVTDMQSMFQGSGLMNLDLGSFNTSQVTNMSGMFYNCSNLTNLEVCSFNTANVTDMHGMFQGCSGLTDLNLGSFNTSQVTNMSAMFANCSNLTTIYVGEGWSMATVSVSNIMFLDCHNLVGGRGTTYNSSYTDGYYARIDGWPSRPGYFTLKNPEAYACYTSSNTTLTFYYDYQRSVRRATTYALNVGGNDPAWRNDGAAANVTKAVFDPSFANASPTSTYSWFDAMTNLQSITGLQYLNTSQVTNMSCMFASCENLMSLDVSGFNTEKVTDMYKMFYGCENLTSLDVSNFNTAKVTTMSNMFKGCSGLSSLDLSSFNTSKLNQMVSMFSGCSGLTSLDLSSFNTSTVTAMYNMFEGCSGLSSLDLSNFNTAQVRYLYEMFSGCSGLTTIYVGEGWSTASVTNSTYMFQGCTSLVGGKGTTYDANHVDKAYAHIDGGTSNPGYFTDKNAGMNGDVNGDGNVNITDVTVLNNMLSNGDPSADDYPTSDIDGNGVINITDVTMLINKALMARGTRGISAR